MRRSFWVMFGVFCLLVASEWLMTPPQLQVRGSVLAVVGIVGVGLNGRRRWRELREVARLALAAVLLFGVPEVVSGAALGHVSGALGTVVFGAVPLVVVVMLAQMSVASGMDARRLMIPALVGLGGVLLLVPGDIPSSTVARVAGLALLGAAFLAAFASVWIHPLLQGFSWVQALAIFCLANACVLIVGGLLRGGRGSAVGGWGAMAVPVVVLGVEVVLLVGLLRRMEPVRFAGRFLVVPLVTIGEGLCLLRPGVTLRMVVGMGLLAGGAGFLLVSRGMDEGASLSLR